MTIDARMTKARSALIMSQPFFGSLALRLQLLEWTGNDTMATNGRQLFYATKFLDEHNKQPDVIEFAVAHEVMHCALKHHIRRDDRDPQLWNIAGDHVVNIALRKAGFKAPDWCICDMRFDGMSVEEVYRILRDEEKAKQQAQEQTDDDQSQASDDTQPGDDAAHPEPTDGDTEPQDATSDGGQAEPDEGSGEPNEQEGDQHNEQQAGSGGQSQDGEGDQDQPSSCGDPGGCGEILDAAPEYDEAAKGEIEAEWEVAVRQAVNVAKAHEAGNTPGFLQRLVDDLNKPRVSWREVLRRFVDPSSTKDYSWRSPNRRFLGRGMIVPGLISDGVNHIGWVTDTSGSIDDVALQQCRAEVQAALDEGAIDKLTVIDVDTCVNASATFERGDQIKFTALGGGGTEFQPAFDWFDKNEPDVSAVVYFTDLCPNNNRFGREPAYPVLWAAYGHPAILNQQINIVPFGEIIDVAQ